MSKYKKLCVSFMSWQKTVPPNQTVFNAKDKKIILPTGKTFWRTESLIFIFYVARTNFRF